ncbi:MAG: SURF1 family protein [Litoreibacter sp.]
MRRMIGPALIGVLGCAILIWLGVWQVQRLSWKLNELSEIENQISDEPVPLPVWAEASDDLYLPVHASGLITDEEIHILMSLKQRGAGYRVISAFETDSRRVLLDRGFIALEDKDALRPPVQATISGNLHWPDEIDSFTPEPDTTRDIWFARDIEAMADHLATEPILIVLRETSEETPVVEPLPINSAGIPNDHLQYAITWFSLAGIWFVMTLYLLWRIRRRSV